MRLKLFLLFCIFIFVAHCGASIDYVKTGKEYPALNSISEIILYKDNQPNKFDEIGFVLTKSGTYEDRLELVKEKAQEVGGNGIIVQESIVKHGTRQIPIYGQGAPIIGANGQIMGYNQQIIGYRPESYSWTEQKFVIIKVLG